MAGDLEEFLKRAAERRAQKQQQGGGKPARQAGETPKPRPKPEYTDSRRERQVRQRAEDAIPVAEIVQPVNPLAEQEKRLAEAKRKAEAARELMAAQQEAIHRPTARDRGSITISGGSPIEQLLDLIQRPGGMQQAFLLREIVDRPVDRWK